MSDMGDFVMVHLCCTQGVGSLKLVEGVLLQGMSEPPATYHVDFFLVQNGVILPCYEEN
jgi:hypothetical protein